MKRKLSTRILSVFLAVLMLASSVPFATITAFAADTGNLVTAMNSYKSAMDGTIKTNMLEAYDAYVNALEIYDAVTYGGLTDQTKINNATTALNTAVGNMHAWSAYKATASVKMPNDSSNVPSDYAKNILYATNPSLSSTITNGTMKFTIAVPATAVILYDGTETRIPVMTSWHNDGGAVGSKRKMYASYPVTNTSGAETDTGLIFALPGKWQGYYLHREKNNITGNGSFIWADAMGGTSGKDTFGGYNNATQMQTNGDSAQQNTNNGYTWWSYANYLNYTGGDSGFSNGLKSQTFGWFVKGGVKASTVGRGTWTDVGTYYVVDYKSVINTLTSSAVTTGFSTLCAEVRNGKYDENGIRNLLVAYSKLTQDPTVLNYASDPAGTATNIARDFTENIPTVQNPTVTTDSGYDALRTAIAAYKDTYDDGQQGYTDGSWGDFAGAYETAVGIFANIEGTKYADKAGAAAAASNLNHYFSLLEDNSKLTVADLINEINDFEAYKDYFTDASANAVQAAIDAAIAAIWEPDDAYPNPGKVLSDTADNQTIYTQQLANVRARVSELRLDPDAVVDVEGRGRKSVNMAMSGLKGRFDAAVTSTGETIYSNPGVFTNAYAAISSYRDSLATAPMTGYEEVLAAYAQEIDNLYTAFDSLLVALKNTPNGTVVKYGSRVTMTPLTSVDKNNTQYTVFAYTDGAIVFKTTHDALNVNYGSADIVFGTNRGKGTGTTVPNNMLDSISINATAPQINGNDGGNHISGTESSNSSQPGALTDTQYEGCVNVTGTSNSGIAWNIGLSNIRYNGTTYNNNADQALTLTDGTTVSFDDAYNYDLTNILGTTQGAATNPGRGGLFARTRFDGGEPAYIYANADMIAHLDATTPIGIDNMTQNTVPKVIPIKIDGYFGAVTIYNTQNTTAWCSYNWVTSATNNEKVTSTVSVVDLTPLVDLLAACAVAEKNEAMYTEESFSQFMTAYDNANESFDYSNMAASAIANSYAAKYRALLTKYRALEIKKLDITFKANGLDDQVIQVEYGKRLSDEAYIGLYNNLQTPTYTEGAYDYSFESWIDSNNNAIDIDAVITENATYTATYIGTMNAADFNDFEAAQGDLRNYLGDNKNTVADLEAAAAAITSINYYDYTEAQKLATMADEQEAINTATAQIREVLAELQRTQVKLDLSVMEATISEVNVDIDRYNVDSLNSFLNTQMVRVDSVKTVSGLCTSFESKEALDQAIRDVLNNVRTYKIYFNGAALEGEFAYGSVITIDSTGSFVTGESSAKDAAWTYSYNAPSRALKGQGQSQAKYMVTAPSYEFVVIGDTYLTADVIDAEATETCTVTVKASLGKIIEIRTVNKGDQFEMPAAPSYAFYSFVRYDNYAVAGDKITVNSDVTITATYEAQASDKYTISIAPSWMSLASGKADTRQYDYNQKVTIKADYQVEDGYTGEEDVFCWVIADFTDYLDTLSAPAVYTPIAYGSDKYAFYACESMYLTDPVNLTGKVVIPITYDEYESFVTSSTDVKRESGRYYANGTYTAETIEFIEKTTDVTDKVVSVNGTPILATTAICNSNSFTIAGAPVPVPTVTAVEDVVPIYAGSKVEKFSMIGNFNVPSNYEIVEYGFLFTSDTSVSAGAMNVENIGTNGIARFKASHCTVGNQFVINIKNPDRAVSFKFMPYIIVKSGSTTEVFYGNISKTLTNNF